MHKSGSKTRKVARLKRTKFEVYELDGKTYRVTPKTVNDFWDLRMKNAGGKTPEEALAQLTDFDIAKKLRIGVDTLAAIEFGVELHGR